MDSTGIDLFESRMPGHETASNMEEPTYFSPPPNGTQSPQWEIEYLARIVHFFTGRTSPPPWIHDHIADDFRADFDNIMPSSSWQEHIELFRKINIEDPGYHAKLVRVIVDVMEHNTHADCYLLVEVSGRPQNIRRHSIGKMKWRMRHGKWQLYRITTIRAPIGSFDGLA